MTRSAAARRKPVIHMHTPIWCHHHCIKMRVTERDLETGALTIAGSAAKITIVRASTKFPWATGWFIDWEVIQYRPSDQVVRGRREFNDNELAAAFGLTDHPGETDFRLLEQFGGDSAEQGLYIRWGDYLNIPCPGTGHDGDPNVSIELDDQIKEAVRALLDRFSSSEH